MNQTSLRLMSLLLLSVLVAPIVHAEIKKPIVYVEAAKATELFESLTYPVRVASMIQSPVLAEFDGTIESLKTRIGQSVQKNQALGTIRNTDPVYDYAPVNLTSPIRGQVASIDVTEGARVVKGQKLLTLIDAAKHQLSMEVPASDLPSIKVNMTGVMTFSGVEDSFPIVVRGISPMVDPLSGTATVEVSLADGKAARSSLPIGAIAKVQFKAQAHQGLEVPESAIVYKGPEPLLRLIEDNKARLVPVTLSRPRRGKVEVLKGLSPGALVVTRASSYVSDGDEVTVQNLEVAKK